MQNTGIKHTSPHSHMSAKQESSNTRNTLNAVKMGSEEKERKGKGKRKEIESTKQPVSSPPPHMVAWGENQKSKSEEHYGLR